MSKRIWAASPVLRVLTSRPATETASGLVATLSVRYAHACGSWVARRIGATSLRHGRLHGSRTSIAGQATTTCRAGVAKKFVYVCWASLLAGGSVSGNAFAEESLSDPTTQQDGSPGTTTMGTVRVQGFRPNFSAFGVSVYSSFGSSGASFGRPNTRSEFNRDGGEKEQDDDDDSGKNCDKGDETIKGNPINIATGNKLEPELDFTTGGEMALFLQRTYNAHWDGISLFGYKWISNFDYRLSFDSSYGIPPIGACYPRPGIPECKNTAGYLVLWAHKPDGRKIKYSKAPDGIYYEDKPQPVSKVVRQANGTWVLHNEDAGVETYSVGGYPQTINNEAGIGWTFLYGGVNSTQLQRVTHTSGRYVDFLWTADELREIRDPAGNSYRYTYASQKFEDGLHVLKTTTLPGTQPTVITYHYSGEAGEQSYGSFAALTGKSFNNARYSIFGYGAGRAISTEHAGGVEKYSFIYTTGANNTSTVVETNPLGKHATYNFKDGLVLDVTAQSSMFCAGAYKETTYDVNGYTNQVADFNSSITDYDYDPAGRLAKMVEAIGTAQARTTTYTWDMARNRVSSVTVVGVNRVDYTYTADNRLATVTQTNLSGIGVANQTRITVYSYAKHPNGLLATATVDGPLSGAGDSIVASYDAFGNLTSIQNKLGHAASYTNYNLLGQPGRVTGPNGDMTDYVYDPRGRISSVKRWVNGAWQTTTYTYDGAGRLASVQQPDGQTRTRVFDAAWRMIREYEPEAGGTFAQTKYTYNNASLVTKVEVERTSAVVPPGVPVPAVPAGSTGNYTVSWGAVGGADSYSLEERVNEASWSEVYAGTDLTKTYAAKPSGMYAYRLKACNVAGCSAPSSPVVVNVAPVGVPTILGPPINNATGTYTVSWTSVATATSYQLEENKNGGVWAQVYNGAATSFPRTKNMSADYGYRVKCTGTNCGAYSLVRTITVDVADPCPACLLSPPPPGEESSAAEDLGAGQ